jgi:hypothetical protein
MSQSTAFESGFANGLDLSEFATATTVGTNTKRTPSHAAQLMKETQKRAEDRRRDDHQELVLGQAVQERLVAHRDKSVQRPEALHHAALIQMHSADQKEPRQRLMKGPKAMSKKKAAGKKQASTKGGQKKFGRSRGKF